MQLVVVSRYAAYGCAMPSFLYDELALRNDPVTVEARDAYRRAVGMLWTRLRLPNWDRGRSVLPPRCDLRWFYETFCGGCEVPVDTVDILPHVTAVTLHDVIALLACCPDALDSLFEVEAKKVPCAPLSLPFRALRYTTLRCSTLYYPTLPSFSTAL